MEYSEMTLDQLKQELGRIALSVGVERSMEMACINSEIQGRVNPLWKKCSDVLPNNERLVLIDVRYCVYPKIASWSRIGKQWASTDGIYYHDISLSQVIQWTEIPRPPQEQP
jgi:hypothetical protein